MAIPPTPMYAAMTLEELVRECKNKDRVIDFLNRERDEVAKQRGDVDGERYRWLRNAPNSSPHAFIAIRAIAPDGVVSQLTGEHADDHIDANIADSRDNSERR